MKRLVCHLKPAEITGLTAEAGGGGLEETWHWDKSAELRVPQRSSPRQGQVPWATGSLCPQGTVGSSFQIGLFATHVPAMRVNLIILFQSYSLFQRKFYSTHLAFFSN